MFKLQLQLYQELDKVKLSTNNKKHLKVFFVFCVIININMSEFFNVILTKIVNPIIYLGSALFFIYFLYGVLNFIIAKTKGKEDDIKKGKEHMLWGLIGVFIIFSASAIYKFITSFFN